eukprot:4735863-Prymnesium_polylepis.1
MAHARPCANERGCPMCYSQFVDRVPHMAHARLCANERARHVAKGSAARKAKHRANEREPHRKKSKTHSTGPSHVVPHHTSKYYPPARASLKMR